MGLLDRFRHPAYEAPPKGNRAALRRALREAEAEQDRLDKKLKGGKKR